MVLGFWDVGFGGSGCGGVHHFRGLSLIVEGLLRGTRDEQQIRGGTSKGLGLALNPKP